MVRIEKNPPTGQPVQQPSGRANIKKEVRSGVRSEYYRRKVGCCLTLVVILAVIVLIVASLFARTGLVTIPVISEMVYQRPEPHHNVMAGQSFENVIKTNIEDIILSRVVGGNLTSRDIDVPVTENDLTFSMRQFFADKNTGNLLIDQSQIAVDPDFGLELYIPLNYNNDQSVVTVYIVPTATDGKIVADITGVKLGQVKVPYFIVRAFANPPLKLVIGALNKTIQRYTTINAVGVTTGILNVSGTITAEIKLVN